MGAVWNKGGLVNFLSRLKQSGFRDIGKYKDGSFILEFRNEIFILPTPLSGADYTQDQIDDILVKWFSDSGEFELVIALRQKTS